MAKAMKDEIQSNINKALKEKEAQEELRRIETKLKKQKNHRLTTKIEVKNVNLENLKLNQKLLSTKINHKRFNSTGCKQDIMNKTGFIFSVVDRQKRDKILTPRDISPPIGKYTPSYELVQENSPTHQISKTIQPRCTFLGIKQSLIQEDKNAENVKCSKFNKKLDDLTINFQSTLQSFYTRPQTPSMIDNEAQDDINDNVNKTSLCETLDITNPLIKKQMRFEHLYGQRIRERTPIVTHKDFLSKYQKLVSFNDTLKDVLSIDLSKGPIKEGVIYQMSPRTTDARFEPIDKFPSILTQNKKIAANIDFKKISPRSDVITQMGVTVEQVRSPFAVHNKKYTQVERKTPNVIFSKFGMKRLIEEVNDTSSNEQQKVNHADFKPKVRIKKIKLERFDQHFKIL